jgi:flavin-dependent dehydrogenase
MVFPISLENYFMEECVIVGGGIAGLSCLNALLDHKQSPLLLEGSTIGTPKMCGEFLAPSAVDCLTRWGLGPIIQINHAEFYATQKQLSIRFPQPAGAMARSEVEYQLADRARNLGGKIRENAHIEKITPGTSNSPYILQLKSGEIIEAKTVFFATGKYHQTSDNKNKPAYAGVKIHFQHIVKANTLQMYSLKHAYLGIVPVSDVTSNCACLIKRSALEKFDSIKAFFKHTISSNRNLNTLFDSLGDLDSHWLEGFAPAFQLKTTPKWENAFWIGDAFATLYPAIGSGFAHSIESAVLAVNYYIKQQNNHFRNDYTRIIKPKVIIGNILNSALLHPRVGQFGLPLMQKNPWITYALIKQLGYVP